jgi:hypothetical protein
MFIKQAKQGGGGGAGPASPHLLRPGPPWREHQLYASFLEQRRIAAPAEPAAPGDWVQRALELQAEGTVLQAKVRAAGRVALQLPLQLLCRGERGCAPAKRSCLLPGPLRPCPAGAA